LNIIIIEFINQLIRKYCQKGKITFNKAIFSTCSITFPSDFMERVQEYARFNQIELANCQEYTKQFEIVAGQTVAVTTVLTPGPYPYLMQPSRSSPILRAHWHVDNVLAG